ncbi:MAG: sigma-70 family RNA polymerase sigma factor [Ruminococcus sp.]|nr:sigma-70 family RNA polymerase sigma factor [Ruminococcus sp.]
MLYICLALLADSSDEESFTELYKNYREKVYKIAFRVLRNEQLAEDAASEAFIRLAKNYDKIRSLEPPQLEYYVILASRSSALDMMRKEMKYMGNTEYNDELMLDNKSIEDYDQFYLKECIKKLSFQDKEILYLKFNCELDYSAISNYKGITAAAARKRLQYAKEHLRKLLENGGESYE